MKIDKSYKIILVTYFIAVISFFAGMVFQLSKTSKDPYVYYIDDEIPAVNLYAQKNSSRETENYKETFSSINLKTKTNVSQVRTFVSFDPALLEIYNIALDPNQRFSNKSYYTLNQDRGLLEIVLITETDETKDITGSILLAEIITRSSKEQELSICEVCQNEVVELENAQTSLKIEYNPI